MSHIYVYVHIYFICITENICIYTNICVGDIYWGGIDIHIYRYTFSTYVSYNIYPIYPIYVCTMYLYIYSTYRCIHRCTKKKI